ncbi:NAD(P)/FAD-dependent oxidoreductase [Clostridium ganghwense]|uniref:FAD-dependent oxidoreductase n=1 Tax=Clostridium ganghwense TaxID=312089 RepID=A0ABT4CUW9_9CLOT|nr:FAD-dependent oxidoreductase [Clostridium ganghwense]MCY6372708.1 FAD-dependent oxidoreductase [Clostridium ganghwense]
MDYDVLILGGGLIGCAVAYELSKYSLNIALIEKDYDIVDDVALVNSAIIYDGVQCDNNIMSKLEVMGNEIINNLSSKFNIPCKKQASLLIAKNEEEEKILEDMYNRAIKRGISNIALLDGKYAYELEPNLNVKVNKVLYSQNTGVICPYEVGIAYGEIAFDNGVAFKLEEKVEDIKKINRGYKVETNKNKFTCRMVINTTPEDYNIDGFKENICERVGEIKYFIIEKSFKGHFSNMVFSYNKDESIYMCPTVQGNYIAAIKTKENLNYEEGYKKINSLIDGLRPQDINSFYEEPFYDDTIVIDDSLVHKGYIKVTGKNYAEVTMTPSIGKIICETVVSNLNCKLKSDFNDKRREIYKFSELSNEERQKIISLDKRYGKIVCTCSMVTEGEIVDAIRRPLGARTVEGIRRRTGAGSGSCRGAHCMNKIVSILARETNKNLTDIVKDSKNSKILLNRIKEFDDM